jgi:hypothetical protein
MLSGALTPLRQRSRLPFASRTTLGSDSGIPLICAAALKAGAEQILSEDLNAGQRIAGIRVVDPFASLKSK